MYDVPMVCLVVVNWLLYVVTYPSILKVISTRRSQKKKKKEKEKENTVHDIPCKKKKIKKKK